MATLKSKQTSIAKVPDLCPTTVKILTHLISRHQLPLILLAHHTWSALPIGGGGHRCANILAHRGPPTPIYWHYVPCANSISISIILYARLFLQSSELGPPNPLTHR